MTDSNLARLTRITESVWGTTPNTPEMTKVRVTAITFKYAINNIRSEEIRDDRLTPDLVQVGARVTGNFGFELSYGAFDEEIEAAMFSAWVKTPEKLNLTSDSSITNVTDSSDTYTVDAGGTAFKAGHLVRASGFTNANNNQLFRVASSTGTTVVGSSLTLTDESAPPAGARLKVVGFQGASGDITAAANGLASTLLDFTTLGIVPGMWLKVGGSGAGTKFANVAANNAFIRATAVSANLITCDNLPSGWSTDNGASKTIQVWMPDYIRVGKVRKSFAYELGFLGQTVPNYAVTNGMMVNGLSLNAEAGAIVTGSFDFLGKVEAVSTTSLDSTPTEAAANDVMNAVNNVSRMAENGALITGPNYVRRLSMSINNNLREQMAIGTMGLIGVGIGDAEITGSINTYFGDTTLYTKYVNGTASSLNTIFSRDSKAYVMTFPRIKFNDGDKPVSGRNQDVMVELPFTALRDSTTGTSFQIDRFEEYVA